MEKVQSSQFSCVLWAEIIEKDLQGSLSNLKIFINRIGIHICDYTQAKRISFKDLDVFKGVNSSNSSMCVSVSTFFE